MMPVRLLVPSECAAKLLDEAALSGAKAELNRFMVADPTKTLLRCFPIVREHNEFVLSGECEFASITLGDAISVLIEGVCAKLKPDWVKFSRIGMQFLTCSQAEQEMHNDESLPLPLALPSFFEIENELASIILKVAEDTCPGAERMLTDYGLTFFIRAGAVIVFRVNPWCQQIVQELSFCQP